MLQIYRQSKIIKPKTDIYNVTHLQAVKNHQAKNPEASKSSNLESVKKYQIKMETNFPPKLLSPLLQHKIATSFCKDTLPQAFEESRCAVCGTLVTPFDLVSSNV